MTAASKVIELRARQLFEDDLSTTVRLKEIMPWESLREGDAMRAVYIEAAQRESQGPRCDYCEDGDFAGGR